jgi:hypothetical protein
MAQPFGLVLAPATASTWARVIVAVPDSSCRKFSAGDAADDAVRRHHGAFIAEPFDAACRVQRREHAVEPVAPAQHRLLAHAHLGRHATACRHELGRPVATADVLGQRLADVARAGQFQRLFGKHHAAGPIVREISPRPSMRPCSTSPSTTAPTPAGVPV